MCVIMVIWEPNRPETISGEVELSSPGKANIIVASIYGGAWARAALVCMHTAQIKHRASLCWVKKMLKRRLTYEFGTFVSIWQGSLYLLQV
jgi:hypothetical protein